MKVTRVYNWYVLYVSLSSVEWSLHPYLSPASGAFAPDPTWALSLDRTLDFRLPDPLFVPLGKFLAMPLRFCQLADVAQ